MFVREVTLPVIAIAGQVVGDVENSPRRILYITYNLASDGDHRERYFADKHASFPPDIDRDREKTYVFRV